MTDIIIMGVVSCIISLTTSYFVFRYYEKRARAAKKKSTELPERRNGFKNVIEGDFKRTGHVYRNNDQKIWQKEVEKIKNG